MTKSDPWHNQYPCPECEADVSVALPLAKYATCEECKTKLEIHPDAEFDEDGWHDRTTLSVVDPEREHIQRMLNHGITHQERMDAIINERGDRMMEEEHGNP